MICPTLLLSRAVRRAGIDATVTVVPVVAGRTGAVLVLVELTVNLSMATIGWPVVAWTTIRSVCVPDVVKALLNSVFDATNRLA